MKTKKVTKNFADVVRAELASDPDLAREVEQERLHADIATQIVRLRTQAGMTQSQLAALVGTQQSVISRIEDADYYGHSLKILQKIAEVLRKRLNVLFSDLPIGHDITMRAFSIDWNAQLKWNSRINSFGATIVDPSAIISIIGWSGNVAASSGTSLSRI